MGDDVVDKSERRGWESKLEYNKKKLKLAEINGLDDKIINMYIKNIKHYKELLGIK